MSATLVEILRMTGRKIPMDCLPGENRDPIRTDPAGAVHALVPRAFGVICFLASGRAGREPGNGAQIPGPGSGALFSSNREERAGG